MVKNREKMRAGINFKMFFVLIAVLSVTGCEKPVRIPGIVVFEVNASELTYTTAVLRARISDLGINGIDDYGFIISENGAMMNPVIKGLGKVSALSDFMVTVTDLKPDYTYYYKAYVSSGQKVFYFGDQLSFKTPVPIPPRVNDAVVYRRTNGSFLVTSEVVSEEGASVTQRGFVWGLGNTPIIENCIDTLVIGSGKGKFNGRISGLTPGPTYYVRAWAKNSKGVTYSSWVTPFSFDHLSFIADADSNYYLTVKIGTQEWMRDNLRTTRYKDGSPIPLVTATGQWAALTTPGYCWYDNDPNYSKTNYGALYNYFTAQTGKLCPDKWHAPDYNDLSSFILIIGGSDLTANKLKEAGTEHWISPNPGTNSTGFNALPAGYRDETGLFKGMGTATYWWITLTSGSGQYGPLIGLLSSSTGTINSLGGTAAIKSYGYSIRCIKDN